VRGKWPKTANFERFLAKKVPFGTKIFFLLFLKLYKRQLKVLQLIKRMLTGKKRS